MAHRVTRELAWSVTSATVRVISVVVLLATAAACGIPAGSADPRSRSDSPDGPSPSGTPPAASSTAPVGASPGAPLAKHLTFELTDVRSGEKFTLGGFSGKVVLVQAMAVW
jgi:hypothetical protein